MEKVLVAKASAFVIPNHAIKLGSYHKSANDSMITYLKKMAHLNEIELDDDDLIVQLWFHSKELESENLSDHGFFIDNDEGERALFISQHKLERVPLKLIEGAKEGETRLIKSYAKICRNKLDNVQYDHDQFIELHLNTKLKQRGYRYDRFGNFEDVIKEVTR